MSFALSAGRSFTISGRSISRPDIGLDAAYAIPDSPGIWTVSFWYERSGFNASNTTVQHLLTFLTGRDTRATGGSTNAQPGLSVIIPGQSATWNGNDFFAGAILCGPNAAYATDGVGPNAARRKALANFYNSGLNHVVVQATESALVRVWHNGALILDAGASLGFTSGNSTAFTHATNPFGLSPGVLSTPSVAPRLLIGDSGGTPGVEGTISEIAVWLDRTSSIAVTNQISDLYSKKNPETVNFGELYLLTGACGGAFLNDGNLIPSLHKVPTLFCDRYRQGSSLIEPDPNLVSITAGKQFFRMDHSTSAVSTFSQGLFIGSNRTIVSSSPKVINSILNTGGSTARLSLPLFPASTLQQLYTTSSNLGLLNIAGAAHAQQSAASALTPQVSIESSAHTPTDFDARLFFQLGPNFSWHDRLTQESTLAFAANVNAQNTSHANAVQSSLVRPVAAGANAQNTLANTEPRLIPVMSAIVRSAHAQNVNSVRLRYGPRYSSYAPPTNRTAYAPSTGPRTAYA